MVEKVLAAEIPSKRTVFSSQSNASGARLVNLQVSNTPAAIELTKISPVSAFPSDALNQDFRIGSAVKWLNLHLKAQIWVPPCQNLTLQPPVTGTYYPFPIGNGALPGGGTYAGTNTGQHGKLMVLWVEDDNDLTYYRAATSNISQVLYGTNTPETYSLPMYNYQAGKAGGFMPSVSGIRVLAEKEVYMGLDNPFCGKTFNFDMDVYMDDKKCTSSWAKTNTNALPDNGGMFLYWFADYTDGTSPPLMRFEYTMKFRDQA